MAEKRKKITIILSKKDMDVIEDKFFCELTDKQHKKIESRLINIWKRLCGGMGDITS